MNNDNLLAWDEDDETPEREAEYRMVLNGLRRTEGFGLFTEVLKERLRYEKRNQKMVF